MNKWIIIVLLSCMSSAHASWWAKEQKKKVVSVQEATDLSLLAWQANKDNCLFYWWYHKTIALIANY